LCCFHTCMLRPLIEFTSHYCSFLSPSPTFYTILMGSISLSSYICMKDFDHIHPPSPFPFTLPLHTGFHPQTVPILCSCYSFFGVESTYLAFSVWLISLNMMVSSSIHFHANDIISFFSMTEKYSAVSVYHSFFIHSSVPSWLL
jgi:hypothetical protein